MATDAVKRRAMMRLPRVMRSANSMAAALGSLSASITSNPASLEAPPRQVALRPVRVGRPGDDRLERRVLREESGAEDGFAQRLGELVQESHRIEPLGPDVSPEPQALGVVADHPLGGFDERVLLFRSGPAKASLHVGAENQPAGFPVVDGRRREHLPRNGAERPSPSCAARPDSGRGRCRPPPCSSCRSQSPAAPRQALRLIATPALATTWPRPVR